MSPKKDAAYKRFKIALAGNPNVGKSTVFNALTGLKQHTGNWPGKTVNNAFGSFYIKNALYDIADLPGSYSLYADSPEEELARDNILFGGNDIVLIVADATCLERNLSFALQVLETRQKTVVCVNLLDEAEKKGIEIDLRKLEALLGVTVVGVSARGGRGIRELRETLYSVALGESLEHDAELSRAAVAYDDSIEAAAKLMYGVLEPLAETKNICPRWLALRSLDRDAGLTGSLSDFFGHNIFDISDVKAALARLREVLPDGEAEDERRERIITALFEHASEIYQSAVRLKARGYGLRDRKADAVLTGKRYGVPVMLGLLFAVLWITLAGSNYPSELLSRLFLFIEEKLIGLLRGAGASDFFINVTVGGIYGITTRVVAVMLPPMAIFFPLFTFLEDLGYLPRVAFNLDNFFRRAGTQGKQALTMCMGFGCNACGITGTRIIESKRERITAVLTNNFIPCNGRFPTLITVSALLFNINSRFLSGAASAAVVFGLVLIAVAATFLVSKLLGRTLLKGMKSSFTLELPPYRRPEVSKIIIRSLLDRTLFVLGRAVKTSLPAGLIIALLANIKIDGVCILKYMTDFLEPAGRLFGVDGVVFSAFILGFPANEIVVPIMIMCYIAGSSLSGIGGAVGSLFSLNGWTPLTALCVLILTVFHFPCGTACLTIKKETGSVKWTLVAMALPTAIGLLLCFIIAGIWRIFI